MLIAGPDGWRDFYPALCADNLARQGYAAQADAFDLAGSADQQVRRHPRRAGAALRPGGRARAPRVAAQAEAGGRDARRLPRRARAGTARRGLARPAGPPGRARLRDPDPAAQRAGDAALQRRSNGRWQGAGVQLLLDMTAAGGDVDGRAMHRRACAGRDARLTYSSGHASSWRPAASTAAASPATTTGCCAKRCSDLPVAGASEAWAIGSSRSFLGQQLATDPRGRRARQRGRMQPVDVDGRVLDWRTSASPAGCWPAVTRWPKARPKACGWRRRTARRDHDDDDEDCCAHRHRQPSMS